MAKSSSPGFFKRTSLVKSLVETNIVASTMKTILVTTTVCPCIVGSFWIKRGRKVGEGVEKSRDGRSVRARHLHHLYKDDPLSETGTAPLFLIF